MKKTRIVLLIFIIFIIAVFATGCWNYREVDKLAIVAGVAVDKGTNGQYMITVEIVNITGGRDTKTSSKIITTEGKTMFDAVRNGISLSGKKLYWSHTEVIILSKEVAAEGAVKVIDWYNRDSEARTEVYILVSQGNSAKEIFSGQEATEEIRSFALSDMLKNQERLSKAPIINVLQFDNDLEAEGISATAPAVNLKQMDGKMMPQIMGTAIFKKDKLIGFLNSEETKDLLFIKNKIKGGVLIEGTQGSDITIPVSLEIFKSKTKVIPVIDNQDININLIIDTSVAIDEIEGTENYIEDEGRLELEQSAGKTIKNRTESLIEKVQSEYDTDIFGFGAKLRSDKNEIWNNVSSNWEEEFKNLEVNVTAKVHVENSAILSKPLKEGD